MADQLHLFETVIVAIDLVADSPRKAFYRLQVVEQAGLYAVVKTSGACGKVFDVRRWEYGADRDGAVKRFNDTVARKMDPKRAGKRRYKRRRRNENP